MRKYFFMAVLTALTLGFTACDDDDEKVVPEGTSEVTINDNNLDVTAENVDTWTLYASAVAQLLAKDASDLNEAWTVSYNGGEAFAVTFKNHEKAPYQSAVNCLEEIVDGCIDIASEVGTAKIGEPRDLWVAGKYTEAVYAVESWYSYHSIDDYANNIQSIRNAFNGTRDNTEEANSIAMLAKNTDEAVYTSVKTKIDAAYNAIKTGMTAPFRDHIGNATVLAAQEACADLVDALENELKPLVTKAEGDNLDAIVQTYVENVVEPTYADLVTKTAALKDAVDALRAEPSTKAFETAAKAWMEAREPWETSEAFLFGPVAELGLDPNMDSWPLDVDAIKDVMNSGKIQDLIQWEGDYDEEDEDIEAVQNVRGFHTLEFLLFKSGKPRTFVK
ncbi:MAG: peptidase M75 [Bacteroidaceae bacterium]|nr:peptidase M75 [Bacteroidaceae bacterium]